MEIWKDIVGYEGFYKISNKGNITSFSAWKKNDFLKPCVCPNGYTKVTLCKEKQRKVFYVHRLVAINFLDNCNGYKQVNHKDGNKQNNCVSNLEWCDAKYNLSHAVLNGLRTYRRGSVHKLSKPVLQKDKNGNLIKEWGGANEAGRELNIPPNNIICCCNKKPKYKTSHGYIWEYKNGENNCKKTNKEE